MKRQLKRIYGKYCWQRKLDGTRWAQSLGLVSRSAWAHPVNSVRKLNVQKFSVENVNTDFELACSSNGAGAHPIIVANDNFRGPLFFSPILVWYVQYSTRYTFTRLWTFNSWFWKERLIARTRFEIVPLTSLLMEIQRHRLGTCQYKSTFTIATKYYTTHIGTIKIEILAWSCAKTNLESWFCFWKQCPKTGLNFTVGNCQENLMFSQWFWWP